MTDFSQLQGEQILRFVDSHFALFASERDDAFPDNALADLERGKLVILRQKEGFAVAFKGRHHTAGGGFFEADLMFLHVLPEYERRGIGGQLVEQVKMSVTPGLPIRLTCEGKQRKKFFERCGFAVDMYHPFDDIYEMAWAPPAAVG